MSEFEKRFGRYAIRNLPLIMIICYAVGYAMRYINPDFLMYLHLDTRLYTSLASPPMNREQMAGSR